MVHADAEIPMDLEVQMRWVHSVVGADRADLFSLGDLLALPDSNSVEVGVEGVGEFQLPVLDPGVSDHHDISPRHTHIPGQYDNAIADCINWAAKSLDATTICDPILSQVTPSTESA